MKAGQGMFWLDPASKESLYSSGHHVVAQFLGLANVLVVYVQVFTRGMIFFSNYILRTIESSLPQGAILNFLLQIWRLVLM